VIIGKYSVNPLDVSYGSYRYEPESNAWEFSIYTLIDDMTMPLVQWTLDKKEIDRWLKKVDKCIEQGKQFQLDSDTVDHTTGWGEEE
jgi:hypothetical protein